MIHAIGAPGKPVRLYVESLTAASAVSQCAAGEVCVEVTERVRPAVISADGERVEATGA